jgi:hypothetical protein
MEVISYSISMVVQYDTAIEMTEHMNDQKNIEWKVISEDWDTLTVIYRSEVAIK